MLQGERAWNLATVDADEDDRVEAKLEVPKDAEPGSATIVVPDPNTAESMEVPFEVLGGGSGLRALRFTGS